MANGYDRQEAARAALNAESAEQGAMADALRPDWAEDRKEVSGPPQELKPSDVEADYVPQPGITPEPEEDDIERQYFRRNMQPFADTALSQMSTDELMQGRGRLALTMAAAGSGTDPIDATQEKANNALLERIDQELRMRGRAF
jgi:hypothetical protein